MKIIKVKSLWPERKNFELHRFTTGNEYIFIHYLTPAEILLDGKWIQTKKGACIIYDKFSVQHFRSPETRLIHDFIHFDANLNEIMAKYGLEFNKIYYPINSDNISSLSAAAKDNTVLQRTKAIATATLPTEANIPPTSPEKA